MKDRYTAALALACVVGCSQLIGADFDAAHPAVAGAGANAREAEGGARDSAVGGYAAAVGAAVIGGAGDEAGGAFGEVGGSAPIESAAGDANGGGGDAGARPLPPVVGGMDSGGAGAGPVDDGWVLGPFTWTTGEERAYMGREDDIMCGLTTIKGRFRRAETRLFATFSSQGNWDLYGENAIEKVSAEAYCYRTNGFVPSAGNQVGESETSKRYELEQGFAPAGVCNKATLNLFAQSAFSVLSGFEGELNDIGDSVRIEQSIQPITANVLHVQSCTSTLFGYSHSFRIGLGGAPDRLARFIDKDGETGSAKEIPEVVVGGSNFEVEEATLAPFGTGMCVLTGIEGQFLGDDESIEIRPELVNGVKKWVMRAHKGPVASYIRGYARCYARDQR